MKFENVDDSNRTPSAEEFAYLVEKFDQGLTSFAESYVKRHTVAEEIVSDVFFKLWEKKSILHEIKDIESYLYIATKNHCLNYIKSKSGKKELLTNHPETLDFLIERFDPEAILLHKELEEALDKAIESLPHSCKAVFKLVRGKGMKQAQAAEILGISPKTVENQMAKAIKRLRIAMEDYHKDNKGNDWKNMVSILTLLSLSI